MFRRFASHGSASDSATLLSRHILLCKRLCGLLKLQLLLQLPLPLHLKRKRKL